MILRIVPNYSIKERCIFKKKSITCSKISNISEMQIAPRYIDSGFSRNYNITNRGNRSHYKTTKISCMLYNTQFFKL